MFESLQQPVINGYLVAGAIVGPGGLQLIKELVQVGAVVVVGGGRSVWEDVGCDVRRACCRTTVAAAVALQVLCRAACRATPEGLRAAASPPPPGGYSCPCRAGPDCLPPKAGQAGAVLVMKQLCDAHPPGASPAVYTVKLSGGSPALLLLLHHALS